MKMQRKMIKISNRQGGNMKHQYCCQNATQEILDHMIPNPEYYQIDTKYLYGCDENDYIGGFACLWSIIRLIYQDIISNPADYGLPLIDDIQYPSFNAKAQESFNSSKRLVGLLGIIGQVGEIVNDELVVPIDTYRLKIKTLKTKDKIPNAEKLLTKLMDFGFLFSDFNGKSFTKGAASFSVSFPDNPNIIKALKGYMIIKRKTYEFYSLHYYLVEPKVLHKNQHCITFCQYLNENERTFYEKFNNRMIEENFHCASSFSYRYTLEYCIPDKDSYIVRCFSDENKLDVRMRLKNIDLYINYIEKMPLHIKKLFMVDSNCKNCTENCGYKREWVIDNIKYVFCSFDNQIHIKNYILDDMECYIDILKLEAKAIR